jgi:hypothetical protein
VRVFPPAIVVLPTKRTLDIKFILPYYIHKHLILNFFYNMIDLMNFKYAVSTDGGLTFTKPDYPNNAIITDDQPYPGYAPFLLFSVV